MNLVMFGPPGSGKGTQCRLLSEDLGLAHLSTGEFLRGEVERDTELGRQARDYMTRGALVPDELIIQVAEPALSGPQAERGFVLDGYPRTLAQAESLEGILARAGRRLDAVINLKMPTHQLVQRLSGRRACANCGKSYNVHALAADECPADGGRLIQREDDRPEAIHHRLDVYLRETSPVLDFYRTRGLLLKVDGGRPVDEVHRLVAARLRAVASC